jgi:hypothetical protein
MYGYCTVNVIFSVVIKDADSDQTCYFDADPAPGLDSGLASNNAIQMWILPHVLHILKNFVTFIHSNGRFKIFLFT